MTLSTKTAHTSLIQRTDYLIATAFLLVSLLALFGAGLIAGTPLATEESLSRRGAVLAQQQCLNSLQALGVTHERAGAKLIVQEASTRSLDALMERSALVQLSCSGYGLESLCAGEQCLGDEANPQPGLRMELALNLTE